MTTAIRAAPSSQSWLHRADACLGRLVEWPTAVLVVAEIFLLFAGLTARYVFRTPLVWGDELAGIIFLWLAMAGAVLALHRGEHMRMTAVVDTTRSAWRDAWNTGALIVSLVFLAQLVVPCLTYMEQESVIRTPALDLSDGWRVAALLVGTLLMTLVGLIRLLTLGWIECLLGVAAMAAAGVFFNQFGGTLEVLGNYNLAIFFLGVVGLAVLGGVPIAFAFGLATFTYLSLSTSMPLEVVVGRMDEGMSQIILLAVPMFIFLGLMIEATGMARAMIDALSALVGHVRGGLGYVLVGAMFLVSGISGSKAADMAAVAPVLFPEMVRRGARPGRLVALLSATGAQTETVPPSIVLITIGSVTGVSISALFTGGLLPGLLLGLVLCGLVWWQARSGEETLPARAPGRLVARALLVALPALVLPVVIRYAVVEGIATATEVSTIGIAYTALIGIPVYRGFQWRRLLPMLTETAALSGAILLIIATATSMAWALTQSGFSATLAAAMTQMPGGRAGFMVVSVLAFVVLGSVLEGIPAIVLFGPLLFPIAQQLGIDEVHYAIVVILSMGLGLFSPPFGVGYYSACAVSRVDPAAGMRPIVGYMVALLLSVAAIAAIPWLSTGFLPARSLP